MESLPKRTPDISEVVVSRDRIGRRVAELAAEVSGAFGGGEVTIVAVLDGALVFLADLMRHLTMPIRLLTVRARRYHGAATTPGALRFDPELPVRLAGRRVLVVDDILDTGGTLAAVVEQVRSHGPACCRTCVLLRKDLPGPRAAEVPLDFVGFDVPDVFVVGYGLDFDGRYRNLPDVVALAAAREGRS
ncbi:MAG TPA: phosphoribosyltransferase family protein [Phycisphaerae bacterium]|nr:phosphoribosyltransferase family protein [Phycisphaerae bacterium]